MELSKYGTLDSFTKVCSHMHLPCTPKILIHATFQVLTSLFVTL